MKKVLLILAVLTVTLNAQVYLDTLVSKTVGPGMVYTKINAPTVPWYMDVLKVDLKNPNIRIESKKALDRYAGREVVSSMVKRRSFAGHYVLGAVNADFFDLANGKPINIQIENGEIIRNPAKLSTIGFDDSNRPMLNIVSFSGKVFAGSASNTLTNVNQTRGTDQLLLYNSYMGATTATNAYGTEVLVRPLRSWMINDTIPCVVEKVESSVGNMAIADGRVVLSGHGTSAAFLNGNVKTGDTLRIFQQIAPGLAKIREMLGGYPKIVDKGLNYADQGVKEEGGPDHAPNREPRTAAGFSADSTQLYLIVLDGRGASAGATLKELADVMIRLGVAYGINFDGGGSSEMYVRNSIMNVPSDGSERTVANALFVVSKADTTPGAVMQFAMGFHRKKLFKNGTLQLSVFGNDKNSNPVVLDNAQLKFTVDPALGTVDSKGLFTAANKAGKGYVYAAYNGLKDSCFVEVKTFSKLVLYPSNIVIDNAKSVQLQLTAFDDDNVIRSTAAEKIVWKSSNTSIASVDTAGIITGIKEGSVKISAALGSVADSMTVTIQLGKGLNLLSGMDVQSPWKVRGQNLDTAATKVSISTLKTEGAGSLKIDFQYKYDAGVISYLYVDTDIPIYGIPDSLFIDTRTDALAHRLYFVFSDDNGELFRVGAYGYINTNDRFNTIPVPMRNFAAVGSGIFFYPVTLKRLEIMLQYNKGDRVSGQSYTGTIYLDNLQAKYPAGTSSVGFVEAKPLTFGLSQNYPNPFNPSTLIEFMVSENDQVTSLKVFDLLGREVAVLADGKLARGTHRAVWNAGSSASGVYFYRLQSGNKVETRKMLFLR
ncbi:MAG: phosphodiester glycosidase family protein [Syntrophothermus sp.]